MTRSERGLVVNADDFGRSAGINRGVARAHEEGIVTSASLMVRWPASIEAAGYSCKTPTLGVGLHVDLGEWVFDDGSWRTVYEVCGQTRGDVEREVDAQLARFCELLGSPPTHLDSHQHVHRYEPIRTVLRERAMDLGVPLRDVLGGVTYRGEFYGQTGEAEPFPEGVSIQTLVRLIREVGSGVTEIACHPGLAEGARVSVYWYERELELDALCSALAVDAVQNSGVVVGTFASLRAV